MGKPVEIAPETRFTYTLTQPVVVNNQETSRPQAGAQPAPPKARTSESGTLIPQEQNQGTELRGAAASVDQAR